MTPRSSSGTRVVDLSEATESLLRGETNVNYQPEYAHNAPRQRAPVDDSAGYDKAAIEKWLAGTPPTQRPIATTASGIWNIGTKTE